ncbi:MAG: LysR family transcriptional regulator [Lautropia sp.]|nr:LysR family transcriptional regulator [Lautropia sp.]
MMQRSGCMGGARVDFQNFDLNLLRVFDEVMAERNISRAARNLAMTQPAASNALRRLREALGDELLVRSGRGVEPTTFALAIWPDVRVALNALRNVVSPKSFDPQRSRETYVIAMADATAALLVPPLLDRMQREAPNATLRLRPLTTRDPLPLLENDELHLAIGHFPGAVADVILREMQEDRPDTFGHQEIYEGQYVCVMREGHPLGEGPLTLDDYCNARHLLVSYSGRPFGFVDEALAARQRTRRIVLTLNQFFTAAQVALQSDLLTVLPLDFIPATGIAERLSWQPLPVAMPSMRIDMVWHRRQEQLPSHRWLRKLVDDVTLRRVWRARNVPATRFNGQAINPVFTTPAHPGHAPG